MGEDDAIPSTRAGKAALASVFGLLGLLVTVTASTDHPHAGLARYVELGGFLALLLMILA